MGRNVTDLEDKHYGRWTVLSKSKIKKGTNICWNCYCDPERGGCGYATPPDKPIKGSTLRSGDSLSCGCLRDDKFKTNRKDNSNKDRNAAVLQWTEYGIPRSKVAKKFKLTRQRLHQILKREKGNHENQSV